jgi:hypothetical protein
VAGQRRVIAGSPLVEGVVNTLQRAAFRQSCEGAEDDFAARLADGITAVAL